MECKDTIFKVYLQSCSLSLTDRITDSGSVGIGSIPIGSTSERELVTINGFPSQSGHQI